MLMLVGIFASTFVTVMAITIAVAWALQTKAELKTWEERHHQIVGQRISMSGIAVKR